MKYIRTNEEIYKLDDEWALFCKDYANNKQADTIEELCDEFVISVGKTPNTEKPTLCKLMKQQNGIYFVDEEAIHCLYIPDLLKTKSFIYGAIWTEWGLKYVAKMNEKGDWELL